MRIIARFIARTRIMYWYTYHHVVGAFTSLVYHKGGVVPTCLCDACTITREPHPRIQSHVQVPIPKYCQHWYDQVPCPDSCPHSEDYPPCACAECEGGTIRPCPCDVCITAPRHPCWDCPDKHDRIPCDSTCPLLQGGEPDGFDLDLAVELHDEQVEQRRRSRLGESTHPHSCLCDECTTTTTMEEG